MSTRTQLILVTVVIAGALPAAAQLAPSWIIPAAAHSPGSAGSFWASDIFIHNPHEYDLPVVVHLLPSETENWSAPAIDIELYAWETVNLWDALGADIFAHSGSAALLVYADPALSCSDYASCDFLVGSRTYTYGNDGGSFGQDVSGVLVAERAWAAGARQDGFFRTNVGIYLPVSPAVGQSVSFTVLVRDGEGAEVATATMAFPEAGMQQRSLESMGVSLLTGGSVEVSCSDPAFPWYGYISRIDYLSGDAVYRPLRGEAYSKDG